MATRPQPLGRVLRSCSGLNRLITRSREQHALLKRVQEVLPSPLNQHCVAALQRDSRLLLYTDSPAWSSRLRFQARTLSRQLRAEGLQFHKITVRVMIASVAKRKLPVHKESRGLSRENASLIQSVADNIDDPELRAALGRLAGRSRS